MGGLWGSRGPHRPFPAAIPWWREGGCVPAACTHSSCSGNSCKGGEGGCGSPGGWPEPRVPATDRVQTLTGPAASGHHQSVPRSSLSSRLWSVGSKDGWVAKMDWFAPCLLGLHRTGFATCRGICIAPNGFASHPARFVSHWMGLNCTSWLCSTLDTFALHRTALRRIGRVWVAPVCEDCRGCSWGSCPPPPYSPPGRTP